jgi:hypothetical protein
MEALDNRLRACALQLGEIYNTDDISRLSIARAADLKSFCIAEEELMTKIAMVDLYHVIGMGKLTPPQMMQFTFAIQKYLHYRPTVKAIVKHLDSIFELPKIPVETQYKLQGLGDITLRTSPGECEVDEASVDDYNKTKTSEVKLPYSLNGRQIKVDMTQFEYFSTIFATIIKAKILAENLRSKITNHVEYFGVDWTSCNDKEASGYVKSPTIFTQLSDYYNKRI